MEINSVEHEEKPVACHSKSLKHPRLNGHRYFSRIAVMKYQHFKSLGNHFLGEVEQRPSHQSDDVRPQTVLESQGQRSEGSLPFRRMGAGGRDRHPICSDQVQIRTHSTLEETSEFRVHVSVCPLKPLNYACIGRSLLENTPVHFPSFKSGMSNLLLLLGIDDTPTQLNILN